MVRGHDKFKAVRIGNRKLGKYLVGWLVGWGEGSIYPEFLDGEGE